MTKRFALCVCAFTVSLVPAIAAAQAAPQQPPAVKDKVEVIATRVPKSPDDVPAAIEVFPGSDLRARGAVTLKDALALAAGVSIAPGGDGGPASSVPEFWGLKEFDAFLLVVDDVPWGGALNPALATLSMRDIERIEVLRGPAPVTFGATSFVGVIHVVHTAAAANSNYLTANIGTFGTGGVAFDAVVGSGKGDWKSRLSFDVGNYGFKDDNTGYNRTHALWRSAKVSGASKVWFSVDANFLRQSPASPSPRQGATLSPLVPIDANHNVQNAFQNENRFTADYGMNREIMSGATWGTVVSFAHSTQRIFKGFLNQVADAANNATGFKESIEVNDLYVDSHVIWKKKSNTQLMAGADLLFANGEAKGATFVYTAPLDGSFQALVSEPATLDLDSEDRRTFFGAYAQVEWTPAARLLVNAGGRMNATTERRGEGASTSHARASGSIGAIVDLWSKGADHLKAFANVRSTFKPAAFDFGLAENEGVLDPETSMSVEAGAKTTLMRGRVDAEANYFDMKFKNLVTATIVNGLPALINAGTTRFKGVDFAADVHVANDIWARGTFGLHDGKFVDFIQDFDGTLTQLGGRRFEMSAKHLASVGVIYGPATGLMGNVTVNYVGDRFLNKRNTALAEPFTTVDVGVGWRFARSELRVDARNLTDRRDPVSESELGDGQYYRMTSRSILVTVGFTGHQ